MLSSMAFNPGWGVERETRNSWCDTGEAGHSVAVKVRMRLGKWQISPALGLGPTWAQGKQVSCSRGRDRVSKEMMTRESDEAHKMYLIYSTLQGRIWLKLAGMSKRQLEIENWTTPRKTMF